MGPHKSGTQNNDNNNNLANQFNCQVVINDIFATPNDIKLLETACGNGSNSKIYKCKSKRCKFQSQFQPTDKILSTVTKRLHDCVSPPGTVYLNCHTSNVIYLITCNRCYLQYVGETAQKLNERINFHKTGFRHPTKHGHCKILSDHFNVGMCKGASYKVQIIEKLEGDGRTERGALDPSLTQIRKQKEIKWIKSLRTAYPYGLNDLIGESSSKNDIDCVGIKFPALNRKYSRIRGIKHSLVNKLSGKDFLYQLNRHLIFNLPNAMNFIRSNVSVLNKSSLRDIANVIDEEISRLPSCFKYLQWYFAVNDAIKTKLYHPVILKSTKKAPENICHVKFCNKAVELINLPRILNSAKAKTALCNSDVNFPNPTVVYNLTSPIYHKIFNFRSFLKEVNVDEILTNFDNLPCDCENSPFKDNYHGHIVTGDLRIIKNNKLRKIICKGPKFRETKPISFEYAKNNISNGLNDCIRSWCDKKGIPEESLTEWKNTVMEEITDRIRDLESTSILHKQSFTSLNNMVVKQALNDLHDNYVCTPIDKASNNVAIICKKIYLSTLVTELGLNESNHNANNTYEVHNNIQENDIIESHSKYLNRLKLKIDNSNQCIPNIYWVPKLHKHPSKARFIIAAPKCSVKPLSKTITSALKLIFKQLQSYNDESRFFSGINSFWTILNNKPVIQNINIMNKRTKASSISCFDFSTLYTKIPHNKLLKVMNELVDFCFKGGDKSYITVNKYGASWVAENKSNSVTFNSSTLKNAIKYLLDNCFFRFGNKIFRQIIGIPMGSDPAPFLANLFLYFYENKWIRTTKKHDIHKARRFGNVFRFIDDLVAINDNGEFEKCYSDIYPPELELKKENVGYTEGTFLDLMINIRDDKFVISLYDKRNTFPFSIVRMPYLESNIPSKMFYSAFGSEILRFARNTSDFNLFKVNTKCLIERMLKQGGKNSILNNVLRKLFGRHFDAFGKYFNDFSDFLNLVTE